MLGLIQILAVRLFETKEQIKQSIEGADMLLLLLVWAAE